MTKLNKMTVEELWTEAEMWLEGIKNMLLHRCYQKYSMTGMRSIQLDVRQHLALCDRVLLEVERRRPTSTDKTEVEQVLERVEEGLATAADAEFLRKLLGLESEKDVPEQQKT